MPSKKRQAGSMKEPDRETATEEQVWKYAGWQLAKNGFDTILVGGAVAAIYLLPH